MPKGLFLTYYAAIVFAAIIGVSKWRQVDKPAQFLIVLMVITTISEGISYIAFMNHEYRMRNTIYHLYNVIQAFLFSAYFLSTFKPYFHLKWLILCAAAWVSIGTINVIFFEPLHTLNSNMLLIESQIFIATSLLYIFKAIRSSVNDNLFKNMHFRMAGVILFMWSGTFFFWSTINVLYRVHWQHLRKLLSTQLIFNTVVYLSFCAVLILHPKKRFN